MLSIVVVRHRRAVVARRVRSVTGTFTIFVLALPSTHRDAAHGDHGETGPRRRCAVEVVAPARRSVAVTERDPGARGRRCRDGIPTGIDPTQLAIPDPPTSSAQVYVARANAVTTKWKPASGRGDRHGRVRHEEDPVRVRAHRTARRRRSQLACDAGRRSGSRARSSRRRGRGGRRRSRAVMSPTMRLLASEVKATYRPSALSAGHRARRSGGGR